MQKIYYEITKTMNNLPISIYPHKKSPCQICTAHWHRSLELSIVFEGKVIFFNDGMKRIYQIVKKFIILYLNIKNLMKKL